MKDLLNIVLLLAAFVGISSCVQSPTRSNAKTVDTQAPVPSTSKKTQVILRTQPIPLDIEDQNKITGEYITVDTLVVPEGLGSQSKWIMFEGPVLENDLVAYRYYADSRHRFDIYGKRVSDMVMDTVSWDYHDVMDWGSDILKVGNSLGLGSPAIWYQDSLYTLSTCDEKVIEVTENASARSSVKTTFNNLTIGEHSFDLIQDWSIEAGKPWSEIHLIVTRDSLPADMYFATGIVKHLPTIDQGESNDYFYAMNWGIQSFHDENLGMAILARSQYAPTAIEDNLNHAFAFQNARKEVTYRMMSAWERDRNEVKDSEGFRNLVENSCQ